MKKALAAAALLVAAVLAWWAFVPGAPVDVTLPAGATASQAGHILRRAGVVPSASLFRLAARLKGTHRKLRPGTYKLRAHMPLWSLLDELENGVASLGVRVVIPEGFAARQIGDRLEALGVCKSADFARYVAQQRYEGYLFPTTYFFDPDTPAQTVAERMRAEFNKRIPPEYDRIQPKPSLTLHQAMTLASIVEREAVLSQEKPTIAAVYLNRMKKRMRLEADPTVQYAVAPETGPWVWKKGLRHGDLRDESPYNTYVHYGLPPGPICSFGVDSFRAALTPAQTDAIFFVADNTGGHIFSATLEEHLKAKQSFKRGLRAIKARLKREEEERQRAQEAGKL